MSKIVPWSEVTNVDYRHPRLSAEIRDKDRFKPTDSRRAATRRRAAACPNSGPLPAGLPERLDVSPKVLFEAMQAPILATADSQLHANARSSIAVRRNSPRCIRIDRTGPC